MPTRGGGDEAARKGMERAVFGPEEARQKGTRRPGWAKVVADYRLLVYGAGEEMAGGAGPEGESKGKRGFSREEIKRAWVRGGKLPSPPPCAAASAPSPTASRSAPVRS